MTAASDIPPPPDSTRDQVLRAAPGVLRISAGAWLRTAEWTINTAARAVSGVANAAISGTPPGQLLGSAGEEIVEGARRILGVTDLEQRLLGNRQPEAKAAPSADGSLRERGADLLNRSADVRALDDAHPAYDRILSELAPDEARILRLFANSGPQAAVDVRTWRPLDVGAQTVAPGLTMIGPRAGVRYIDRVPAYLNNLFRLGLIWFSHDPLDDLPAYQVLEAQPDVLGAMRSAGRAKIVRRSILLTPFGVDFCSLCLPANTAGFDAVAAEAAAAST